MELVEIFKALADETRIRMINLLREGELCVCDIESILSVQQSNASRHLYRLKAAGLIVAVKKSQWVYYSIHQKTLLRYPFLNEIIEDELGKIKACRQDLIRLHKRQAEGTSCAAEMKLT